MRLKLFLSGAILVPALLLVGCGMGTMSDVTSNMDSPALSGQAFGGQAPISGAAIEVVAMGTTGYGSQGTVLAITTTDASGNFQFASGAYTCPQSNTPVYLMAIGGDAGSGNNVHIANAAGLGTCTNAKSSFVVVNEVTTVALAYSLAQFFTPTIGGNDPIQADDDWFGGPSSITNGTVTYSNGLVLGNSYTIPALVNMASGRPNASTSTVTVESAKIYTIANILAACVNTDGSMVAGQPCKNLFTYAKLTGVTAPYDTLQAAVEIARSEYSISTNQHASTVSNLYGLSNPPTPAFSGGLTGVPNDFTLGISYTSSAFGLGVTSGLASTLDIDSTNRIWFPSNATGEVGAGFFDQTSRTFNGPYNGVTSQLLFPEQVAIDQSGYAWYNDIGSDNVDGFLSTSPTTVKAFSLLFSSSNALTIGEDNTVNVGITGSGNNYELANINAARTSYTLESGTSGGFAYPVTSIAADPSLDNGVSTTLAGNTALHDYLVTPSPTTVLSEIVSGTDNSGQVIYVGSNPDNGATNEFIATRPFSSSASSTPANDGLCIFSLGACKTLRVARQHSPVGIAIDGAKNLWLPESVNGGLVQVTPTGNSGVSPYTTTTGVVPNSEYLHGTNNGGTLTTPYGVAIDNAGNVWISNAGCTTAPFCTPGNFTLTEIVGVAAPTITPVSAQIAAGNFTGTKPTR